MVQYTVNWDSYNNTLPMIVEVPKDIPSNTVAQWLFGEYDTYTLKFEVYDPKSDTRYKQEYGYDKDKEAEKKANLELLKDLFG